MFWEIEEPPASSTLTPKEAEYEAHFQATHQRDSDGRYIVNLPFQKKPDLPGLFEIAKSRFLSSEKRLNSNQQLYEAYKKFMKEYHDLFRQFKVHPDDCVWQRIIWRPSYALPIETYRLRTVTYGTAPAPYLAIRCLQ